MLHHLLSQVIDLLPPVLLEWAVGRSTTLKTGCPHPGAGIYPVRTRGTTSHCLSARSPAPGRSAHTARTVRFVSPRTPPCSSRPAATPAACRSSHQPATPARQRYRRLTRRYGVLRSSSSPPPLCQM